MDNRFLHKVVDQIVHETIMDYGMEEIQFPFSSLIPLFYNYFHSLCLTPSFTFQFTKHCEEVYGLNEQEIEYVWKEYEQIIKDKIKNNGL